jgi:hypothetical protein
MDRSYRAVVAEAEVDIVNTSKDKKKGKKQHRNKRTKSGYKGL